MSSLTVGESRENRIAFQATVCPPASEELDRLSSRVHQKKEKLPIWSSFPFDL